MDENTTRGTSRREALKRAAAVGAAAWTAPIVSTFNTPAFAQTVVSPSQCRDWNCGDPFFICGSSGPLDRCLCDVDTEGNQFCWEDQFCANVPGCTTSADCPPGWRCVTNCCTGANCFPECGTNANVSIVHSESDTATGSGRV